MEVEAEFADGFDCFGVVLDFGGGRLRVHEPLSGEVLQVEQLAKLPWQSVQSVLVEV